MNRNANRKKNKRNRNNNRKRNRRNVQNNSRHLKMTRLGAFVPEIYDVILRFNDITVKRSAASGLNVMNWAYRSSAFDPDPAVLTGSIPGFTELGVLYNSYIVTRMVLHVELCNQETNGLIVGMWPGLDNYGVNALTADEVREYSGNPGGKSGMVGNATGYPIYKNTISTTARRMFGTYGYTDLDHAAATNANPVEPYWLNIGLVQTQNNFSFAVGTMVRIDYHIRFFAPAQLAT